MTDNFPDYELRCKCGCGVMNMEIEFMQKMQTLRDLFGRAIIVSSAYRCPDYNERVSKSGINGPHTTGQAIDCLVSGEDAHRLLTIACGLGSFTGIGISQIWSY